jgi:multidrug efflux pump subunit AcrB
VSEHASFGAAIGAAIASLLLGVAVSLLLAWLLSASLAPSCNERLAAPHTTCWSPSRLVRDGDQWLCRCPSSVGARVTREVNE